MNGYAVVVNENMYDAAAWIVELGSEEYYIPLSGWEKVWGYYESRWAAESALVEAREYVAGRRL